MALLTLTSTSVAKDRPVADHTQSLTVAPFKLIEPRAHLEYERSLSDTTGFTVGATFGKYNPLVMRIINALGVDYSVSNIGVNAAFNYHFKHFNRGWFVSGGLWYDNFSAKLEGEDAGGWSTLKVGPTFGYKIAAESGFTFAFDAGFGYGLSLGSDVDDDEVSAGSSGGLAYLGSTSIGWSF